MGKKLGLVLCTYYPSDGGKLKIGGLQSRLVTTSETLSKITRAKMAGGVAQQRSPEFKTQYCQKRSQRVSSGTAQSAGPGEPISKDNREDMASDVREVTRPSGHQPKVRNTSVVHIEERRHWRRTVC
jgi:hypothetical protein